MQYRVPFGNENLTVELPQSNVIFYADMVRNQVVEDVHALVDAALDKPIGTPRLEEMVKPSMKVMIISDDITRPTPKRLLITHILDRLARAGVKDSNILICLAPGTHRRMTDSEMEENFGKDLLERFEFLNINYKDTDRLINIGETESGIPIDIYDVVEKYDFIIGIGNIVPHVSAGWGGGAKIVQPGICGERTTAGTHLIAALDQNVMATCGNADNKCRHEMEAVARKVGLRFIVNTVMDPQENVLGVFCGDFIAAHNEGIKKARLVQCPAIPKKADIVIASANPCNIDFWQGDKPFVFSQFALNDNGVLIFAMSGEEGLCGNAPDHDYVVRHYALLGEARIREDVKSGVIKDVIAIDAPIHLEQVRDRGVRVLLVSNGCSEQDAKDMGWTLVPTLEKAVSMAFEMKGSDASVGIIPYCGETLVEVRP